ncbi:hypothetical protein [Flavobacterium sp. WG21]|uniref:hypothetical protein n=1 Tax=Flavobacterium sp. WG21 TaxID=1229487 RepID=UPI0003684226|nr:hypothetical protein [Flavobacterium sp. WG21]
MNKIIRVVILILLSQNFYAQEKGPRIYSSDIDEFIFYRYQTAYKIKATKDFKTIKNEFPEDLMQSIISCSNEEWEIFNTLGGKNNAQINDSDYYEAIKKMDVERNYFELKHKIEFEIDQIPTAIIKFYFINQYTPQPEAGIIVMQKYNNRWYKTSTKMVASIAMIILKFKTDELEKIINGNVNSPELLQIHKKVFTKDKLDFNKLQQEMDSWYIEETKENILKKQYFKDPNSIL